MFVITRSEHNECLAKMGALIKALEQADEIKNQQSQSNQTKRVTAPELENILYEAIPLWPNSSATKMPVS